MPIGPEPVKRASHGAEHAFDLVAVDRVGRLRQLRARAERARQRARTRRCRAESTARRSRWRPSGTWRRCASRIRRRCVTTSTSAPGKTVADVRQHVRVGDLRRDEGVDRDLRQLGVHEIHAPDRGRVVAARSVDAFEDLAGPRVRLADQNHVGPQHVAHDAAERDELGVVAEAERRPDLRDRHVARAPRGSRRQSSPA